MGAKDQGTDATAQRWLTIPRTLCFIRNGGDVLLMKRAAHKRIFPGMYNGIGGHLERDEDPLSGAMREIREETGLSVADVRFRGVSNIDAGQQTGIILFIFTAVSTSRDLAECEEGSLHWIPIDQVDQLPLVEDIPVLLPLLFGENTTENTTDTPFFAHVRYDNSDRMIMSFAAGA